MSKISAIVNGRRRNTRTPSHPEASGGEPHGARRSCGLVELAVVAVFSMLVGVTLARGKPEHRFEFEEDAQLAAAIDRRYAPYFSNAREEGIIRDFFQDERGGVFVDVGAYEWRDASNTYRLEHDLGWSGVAIDVSPEYADGYHRHRPRTKYITAFIDAVDGEPRTFQITWREQLARLQRSEIRGTSARLDTVLTSAGIQRVDLLTMDIELAEPKALLGFSIERYRPRLVCIEMHPPVRQFILDHFARAGYTVVGKYLPLDAANVYFSPSTKS